MTDSIIEKAEAVLFMARKGKVIAANGDNFHLAFLMNEILKIESSAFFVVKKNRVLIKVL